MINIFINSTTWGQAMSATFNMSIEGSVAQKRLTPIEECTVNDPVYEKVLSAEKVAQYIAQGKKVGNLDKAVITENIRVNSLNALIKELEFVSNYDNKDMIIAYVPTELLQELESGRIKFYLAEDSKGTTYYSDFELELWKKALPLIQDLYCRIVFKDINACKKNVSKTQIQADRVSIYNNMYAMLLTAFREMKAIKAEKQVSEEGIF